MPDAAAVAVAARTPAISTMPLAPTWPAQHIRAHSHAIPAPASAVTIGSHGQPNQAAAIASGARTSADRKRKVSEPGAADRGSTRANAGPVAPLATAVFGNRLFKIGTPEIGPQCLGEDQLGIGALP
jgi:hypothetical protein